jgi:RNA polymerase sigma-32 factor
MTNQEAANEKARDGHQSQIGEGVKRMRYFNAYMLDGRGQTVEGRRPTPRSPLTALDDHAHDAPADADDEAIIDAEWEEEHAPDPLAAANDNAPAEATPGAGRLDAYTTYMASLRDLPRLDREQEHEVAVRYRDTRDAKLARQLVTSNLKLVVKLAHEYTRAHRNLLDLIQEGNVGLVQAVEKYDPDRGVKLSSYAAWWIRAYMLRYILQNARLVRLGTTAVQRKLFFNLRKEKAKLERMGFVPSTARVAKAMRVPEHDVIEMEQRLGAEDASLDAPLARDGEEGRSRLDLIESPSSRPDVAAEDGEFRERLHETLVAFGDKLKGRDRALFEGRFIAEKPRTLQELGDDFGISRERTRQLEVRLMARLKIHLQAQLGDAIAGDRDEE